MNLNDKQLDILKEVGNIGSGHAATSLSMMLNHEIGMNIPEIFVADYEEIETMIGQLDFPQAVVYVKVEGPASGKAIFFLTLDSLRAILGVLFNQADAKAIDVFNDKVAQSAFQEIGNIMVSSFIVALTELCGIYLQVSVPAIAVDMIGAIWDAILLEDGELDPEVLFINTQLTGIPQIDSQFIFIPDEGSMEKILGALE